MAEDRMKSIARLTTIPKQPDIQEAGLDTALFEAGFLGTLDPKLMNKPQFVVCIASVSFLLKSSSLRIRLQRF